MPRTLKAYQQGSSKVVILGGIQNWKQEIHTGIRRQEGGFRPRAAGHILPNTWTSPSTGFCGSPEWLAAFISLQGITTAHSTLDTSHPLRLLSELTSTRIPYLKFLIIFLFWLPVPFSGLFWTTVMCALPLVLLNKFETQLFIIKKKKKKRLKTRLRKPETMLSQKTKSGSALVEIHM